MDQDQDTRHPPSSVPISLATTVTLPPTSELDIPSPEICVICLELLADTGPQPVGHSPENDNHKSETKEVATAYPCRHAQFHLSCLGTWLSHSPTCPLCKTTVASISVRRSGRPAEVITLPSEPSLRSTSHTPALPTNTRHLTRRSRSVKEPIHSDPIIAFRQHLYIRLIPSSYLGRGNIRTHTSSSTHHQSRRRPLRQPITPTSFSPIQNPNAASLLRLATIWIRRELQLFDFLQPSSAAPFSSSSNPSSATHTSSISPFPTPSRKTTPHYLLPYIMAIIQQIDLKGSAGQAVELIGEYLGKKVAALFCHELHAFLSSGAGSVDEWDGVAQYWFEREGLGVVRNGRGEIVGRVEAGQG